MNYIIIREYQPCYLIVRIDSFPRASKLSSYFFFFLPTSKNTTFIFLIFFFVRRLVEVFIMKFFSAAQFGLRVSICRRITGGVFTFPFGVSQKSIILRLLFVARFSLSILFVVVWFLTITFCHLFS